jgi:hypothetical protein
MHTYAIMDINPGHIIAQDMAVTAEIFFVSGILFWNPGKFIAGKIE